MPGELDSVGGATGFGGVLGLDFSYINIQHSNKPYSIFTNSLYTKKCDFLFRAETLFIMLFNTHKLSIVIVKSYMYLILSCFFYADLNYGRV